jgi:hypothetical protein
VFAGGCPDDVTLASGDTSGAVATQTADPATPFEAVQNLSATTYGFAFLARTPSCTVVAFGCTEADLTTIVEVRTAIRNWTGADTCAPGTIGGC